MGKKYFTKKERKIIEERSKENVNIV